MADRAAATTCTARLMRARSPPEAMRPSGPGRDTGIGGDQELDTFQPVLGFGVEEAHLELAALDAQGVHAAAHGGGELLRRRAPPPGQLAGVFEKRLPVDGRAARRASRLERSVEMAAELLAQGLAVSVELLRGHAVLARQFVDGRQAGSRVPRACSGSSSRLSS
jgi:hypothetical protein